MASALTPPASLQPSLAQLVCHGQAAHAVAGRTGGPGIQRDRPLQLPGAPEHRSQLPNEARITSTDAAWGRACAKQGLRSAPEWLRSEGRAHQTPCLPTLHSRNLTRVKQQFHMATWCCRCLQLQACQPSSSTKLIKLKVHVLRDSKSKRSAWRHGGATPCSSGSTGTRRRSTRGWTACATRSITSRRGRPAAAARAARSRIPTSA